MDDYTKPLFATVNDTCERFGTRPSKLYELLGSKLITAKKFGKRLLIDQRSAQKYFDALPEADIRPSRRVLERATLRLNLELSTAATRAQARAISAEPQHKNLIGTLPAGEREKFLAAVQDVIAEKKDD
jgi:hypothetical protein